MSNILKKQKLLNVDVTNEKEETVLKYVFGTLLKSSKKYYIVTPNPEMVVLAQTNEEFRLALNNADIALPDGIGLVIASHFLGTPIKERITGVDFMEKLCRESAKEAVSIGLLGAGIGVAEKAADCLRKKYPGINIVFVGEEWPGVESDKSVEHRAKSLERTKLNKTLSSKPLAVSENIDILFVAFGHPKQEMWISTHLDQLPIRVAMGVGGAFDYLAGDIPRAPFVMRSLGFEWLYRLIHQPWRWRRQLALLSFIWLVLKARLIGVEKS